MKGVTAVIAVILLLLITIAIVGFAFVYLNRIATQVGATAENETLTEINRQGQRLTIVNIDKTNYIVTLRHTGTAALPGTSVSTFSSDAAVTCSPALPASIEPGSVVTCNVDSPASCTSGMVFRVVTPGGADAQTC